MRSTIWLVFAVLAATGCRDPALLINPHANATRIATDAGFERRDIDSSPFVIATFFRAGPGNRLRVYIEGDGRAWLKRYQLSANPTPVNPVALRLAVQDRTASVLYLARPCQFTAQTRRGCRPQYWSSHRFAPVVVQSMNGVINTYLERLWAEGNNTADIELAGYSGGAAIAALIAAMRADVKRVISIAGNLDHAAWTAYHGVSPLRGSLNPADAAGALSAMPQIHFVGGHDRIIPQVLADGFVRRLGPYHNARIVVEPDFDHTCCWADNWMQRLCRAAVSTDPESSIAC
ncbi:MAG: alpha/beta hydrolase [Gammaproteobacteria bacterium]|nr:alpha/beta hydrolase [Gammaproteobacteria bacterium]